MTFVLDVRIVLLWYMETRSSGKLRDVRCRLCVYYELLRCVSSLSSYNVLAHLASPTFPVAKYFVTTVAKHV